MSRRIRWYVGQISKGMDGKRKFFRRMRPVISKYGIDMTEEPRNYDIAGCWNLLGDPKKKRLIRLDNLYFISGGRENVNKRQKRYMNSADAIVWQSQCALSLYVSVFGPPIQDPPVAVILNGAPNLNLKRKRRLAGSPSIITSTRKWNDTKRMHIILNAFNIILKEYKGAKLHIVGDPRRNSQLLSRWLSDHKSIIFHDLIKDDETLLRMVSAADIFAHTVFQDSSPNAVVEALSVGTPVVCGSIGGQSEMVDDGVTGIVCEIDPLGPVQSIVPWTDPCGDCLEYARGLKRAIERLPWRVHAVKTEIDNISRQYSDFIHGLL